LYSLAADRNLARQRKGRLRASAQAIIAGPARPSRDRSEQTVERLGSDLDWEMGAQRPSELLADIGL